jgi:cytochrome c oxidase accessory protein FixG
LNDLLPVAEDRVLSTLNVDGSRRWLYPRVSIGRFLRARRWLAYALIAVFTLAPYLRWHGKPLILLDIPAREFTIGGFTFLPTDTLLLALFLVSVIVTIVLATALLGRVWCGWMCPQTVYMEFVYRPWERWLDGPPGPRHSPGKKATPGRTALKYLGFLLISAFLAHTFLAYFVGIERLAVWIRRSPLEHPTSFLVMLAVTGLMMFDFAYFREQTCLVACPYGRFQSVMLDRDSLIVSYDSNRGEPRNKPGRGAEPAEPKGDCIDCGFCQDTCPTGIDIRNGLQMECIACTQCIDACDRVMERLGKPRGLVRFSSQARMAGMTSRSWRPRVVVYPALLLVLLTAFTVVLLRKQPADVTLLRGLGTPFTELVPGQITNQIRIKIKNRTDESRAYEVAVIDEPTARLTMAANPVTVTARQSRTEALLIALPRAAFAGGTHDIRLRVSDGKQFRREFTYRLLGPVSGVHEPRGDDG